MYVPSRQGGYVLIRPAATSNRSLPARQSPRLGKAYKRSSGLTNAIHKHPVWSPPSP